MPTKTLNISIPLEMQEFLSQNPQLSPSKIFQQALTRIQEQRKDFEHLIRIKENIINNMGAFLNEKNLWGEFQKWKLT